MAAPPSFRADELAPAQPVSPATTRTKTSPDTIPKAAALFPLTTIDLPVGNYPSVGSHVVENAAPTTPVASKAQPTFATIDSEDSFATLGADWDALVRAM